MFIEAVEMPPAICEIRENMNDAVTAPCRVVADIDSPVSALLFDLGSMVFVIAGDNMPYGRIRTDAVNLIVDGETIRSRPSGECEIKSRIGRIECEFKLADTVFYLTAKF